MKTNSVRRGFTLVEMLVAVGLTVLVMALFITIFQMATGAMIKSKGIAATDQKIRLSHTVIASDLQKRTFRNMLPIKLGQPVDDAPDRQGYFSISENDASDDADDVLSFTISTTITRKNKDTHPVYGKSVLLAGSGYQQPEFDDGQMQPNEVSCSVTAEVCYFLRNGVLYRRVNLIRSPYASKYGSPQDDSGQPLISGPYTAAMTVGGSGEFWRDFDYAACNVGGFLTENSDTVRWLTVADDDGVLGNTHDSSAVFGSVRYQLGMPNMRFGHNILLTGQRAGTPMEYDTAGKWMGRYTHEETSHADFDYPGVWNDATYPMGSGACMLDADGIAVKFKGGPRRGEDVLLTNVHAFDIKVYDPIAGGYRDLGYCPKKNDSLDVRGAYWRGNCVNPEHGARTTSSGDDGQPGEAGVDDDENGTVDDPSELGWAGTDDKMNNVWDSWHPNFYVDHDGDNNAEESPYPAPTETIQEPIANGKFRSRIVPIPLKSIQIRLRFLDSTSGQMRDVTFQESLVDG